MSKDIDRDEVEILDERREYTIDEMCRVCRLSPSRVTNYIQHGVLNVEVSSDDHIVKRTYTHIEVTRLARAVKVEREFEVDIASLALVLDLLDRLNTQRSELAVLRRQTNALR